MTTEFMGRSCHVFIFFAVSVSVSSFDRSVVGKENKKMPMMRNSVRVKQQDVKCRHIYDNLTSGHLRGASRSWMFSLRQGGSFTK